ncbi:hypothetical protein UFOVP481_22 [uncultured Caudovirales phage]|uniref:Uncharacterized protein n=1 Tax=uncultured Caudovirales phage TaxID=2100421 RepID=A0A6J5MIU6_9CAUD|nr:hypothetical protein UFOVP481_22 [uncultured Caudovirales phage]CAB4191017.1 hypothetical protein UFOVP1210_25 [uncultured Caudovirales phage]
MAGTTTYFGISYPTSTDLVKDGASNMQTIATGFDSAVAIPTYNNQTGTTYTFALSDIGKTVTASNAGASTYTIPPTASVTWPSNATLNVVNLGAGVVTFAAGAGVTVTNTAATLSQYQTAQLVRTGLNAWTVIPSGGKSGLTLVKTQTIGTAVTSVAVTDAFSATYDNYRVIVSGGTSSTGGDLAFNFTGSTTGYYAKILYGAFGDNSVTGLGSSNTANWPYAGSYSTTNLSLNLDLFSPFLTKMTRFGTNLGARIDSGGGGGSGYHSVASSFTGFTLTPSSGTLTGGEIRIYGYQNS